MAYKKKPVKPEREEYRIDIFSPYRPPNIDKRVEPLEKGEFYIDRPLETVAKYLLELQAKYKQKLSIEYGWAGYDGGVNLEVVYYEKEPLKDFKERMAKYEVDLAEWTEQKRKRLKKKLNDLEKSS